jgi:transcriptional regulator with XRE-family HTH domain
MSDRPPNVAQTQPLSVLTDTIEGLTQAHTHSRLSAIDSLHTHHLDLCATNRSLDVPQQYKIHPLEGVADRRQLLKVKATDLAAAVGLETASYRRLERGQRRCYLDKALIIAELLQCTLPELGIIPNADERKRLFDVSEQARALQPGADGSLTPEQAQALWDADDDEIDEIDAPVLVSTPAPAKPRKPWTQAGAIAEANAPAEPNIMAAIPIAIAHSHDEPEPTVKPLNGSSSADDEIDLTQLTPTELIAYYEAEFDDDEPILPTTISVEPSDNGIVVLHNEGTTQAGAQPDETLDEDDDPMRGAVAPGTDLSKYVSVGAGV